MGIHGLTEYLKKEAPDYVQTVDVRVLGLRRVALDGHQWMTMTTKKVVADAHALADDPWAPLPEAEHVRLRQDWLRQALQTTCQWLGLGLEPVWVFDGPAPVAKDARKAERLAARQRALERLAALRQEVVPGPWGVNAAVRGKVASLQQQVVSLQPGWQEALTEVLTAAGVPWAVGATEGEKVACALWKAGVVDAVVSTDTDCLVYGCDRVLVSSKALRVGNEVQMTFYARSYILEFLGMTDAQFTEFCIACGCDYNTHIPKVGPVKVHELMTTYGALANWPATYKKLPLDQACLNVDVCKALFALDQPWSAYVARRSASLAMRWDVWQRCDDALGTWVGTDEAAHALGRQMRAFPLE